MSGPIRIRAQVKDGVTDLRVLATHPTESGYRMGPGGVPVPAHHITDLSVRHGERVVLQVRMGGGLSTNPFLSLKFKGGAKGDPVSVTWVDTEGESRTDDAKIS